MVTEVTAVSSAQLVKEARQLLRLTQAQLGALIDGRTKRTVIRWEQGSTPVPADALTQLAARVGELDPALATRLSAKVPAAPPAPAPLPAAAAPPSTASVVAAVQRLRAAPASARSMIHAALLRAETAGVTLKSLRLALEQVDPMLTLG